MVLLTAGAAVADTYFYMDDIMVPSNQRRVTVPIKAHMNGRVSGFQVDLTYPEGLTPSRVTKGADLTVNYFDGNGMEDVKEATYFANNDFTRLMAVFMDLGYYDPDNDGIFESYGVIKWDAGEYDDMLQLTFRIAEDFVEGDIVLVSEVDAGDDTRGGTVRDLGEASTPYTYICHVIVEPDPEPIVTPAPYFDVEERDDCVVVTAIGEGEVHLYLFGDEVPSPYTIQKTHEAQVCEFIATAQGEGMLISDPTPCSVDVPALIDPSVPTGYTLTLADAEVLHGRTVIIPASMTNDELVTAFQTDLYLPEGFELQGIELTNRKTDQQITWNVMSSGAIRILCYSPSLQSFNGYEGVLFNITVKVPDNAAGDYPLYLKKSLLTTEGYAEVRCEDAESNLNVWAYIKGDANGDGVVDIADVVATAQYILGLEPNPFVLDAADMNDDGEITVTDVVLIIRGIMDPTNVDLQFAPARGVNNDMMSAEDIQLSVGETRTVTIALDNAIDYTAFQFDVKLPDGLTADNFRVTDRAGSHAFSTNEVDGKQRVMCYSPVLAAIAGHEGALLTFDVTASSVVCGDIMVDGIEMVSAACGTVYIDSFAIGVNSDGLSAVKELAGDLRIYAEGNDIIIESPVSQEVVISDVAGRAYSVSVTEGRNVIPARFSGVVIVSAGSKTAKLMVK